ncbi:MAG TPA: DNA-processing protein DprA, partial [Coxiellaceae bacterium]|nr:DNA-processing protein DprA [Coxiellaceae bacterium]
LATPQIAMVGSRNPSPIGLELAREFAFDFATVGLCVTSGLALGIDGASHEGALKANGKTIAVLGAGLHHIYPQRHVKLSEKIATHGALVSEFPLQIAPMSKNFPRRNRIVSGLSLGTLVVEAALKSGSLITAHYALEQNRDVFAIPGSVRNATSSGCLSLIQQGAACVICADDVLKALSYTYQKTSKPQLIQSVNKRLPLDCQEQQVLACIDDVLTTVDQICARCRLSAQIVSTVLLQLELKAAIKRCHVGYVRSSEAER